MRKIAELITEESTEEYSTYGRHIMTDLLQIDGELLTDIKALEAIVIEGSLKSGATVLSSVGIGNSALIMLSESHVAIHVYPNEGIAIMDAYTCGETVDPQVIVDYIVEKVKPKQPLAVHLTRGLGQIEIRGE